MLKLYFNLTADFWLVLRQIIYSMCLNLHNCKITVNNVFTEIYGCAILIESLDVSPPWMQLVMQNKVHAAQSMQKWRPSVLTQLYWYVIFLDLARKMYLHVASYWVSLPYTWSYKHFPHWCLLESNTKQIVRSVLCGHFLLGINIL